MLKQSGLFEVISKSIIALFNFKYSFISIPNGASSGRIINPCTGSSPAIPNSSSEQNIPLDTTPLILPFLISLPSANIDL